MLVVGDNPDSEIEAGKRLGMETIQILRPGVPRSNSATRHIQSLVELNELMRDRSLDGSRTRSGRA